jgi:hypothetical protein
MPYIHRLNLRVFYCDIENVVFGVRLEMNGSILGLLCFKLSNKLPMQRFGEL